MADSGEFQSDDGLRLRYEVDGDGPLLVCHPGGPGRAGEYLEDLAGLTSVRRLVRLDARGTGRSETPPEPSGFAHERMVDDLERLRTELGLDRMELFGHSAGGRVALAYAAAHPERLSRLVLVTTFLSSSSPQAIDRVRASRADEPWYPEAAEAASVLADDSTQVSAAEQQRLSRLLRPFYYGRWDERCQQHAASADRQMSPRAELGYWQGMPDADELRERLARFDVPALVVAGELDSLTPTECAEEVAAALPSARLVVLAGAGHFPWVDEPEAFRAAVAEFLASSR